MREQKENEKKMHPSKKKRSKAQTKQSKSGKSRTDLRNPTFKEALLGKTQGPSLSTNEQKLIFPLLRVAIFYLSIALS